MNKKIMTLILSSFLTTVFADSIDIQENVPDGTNLMATNYNSNLNQQFVSSKRLYSINDAKATIKMFNLNLVVNGQSNTNIPSSGVMIVSNGTARDYLNVLGNQFGYSWVLSGSNIVFTPIVAKVIPTPTPTPKPVITMPTNSSAPPKNNQVVIVSQPKNQVYKKVESDPVKPTIKTSTTYPDKNNGHWVMSLSDGTVRKALKKWADEAGWQLIWNANIDFPIKASMVIDGPFDYAVNEICRASQSTNTRIVGEFHPKNKVVVISAQDD